MDFSVSIKMTLLWGKPMSDSADVWMDWRKKCMAGTMRHSKDMFKCVLKGRNYGMMKATTLIK